MDDAQIINLYFARDENAIVETKNKYQNMCYIVAHNILYSREDSEECVNDTWLFTWNSCLYTSDRTIIVCIFFFDTPIDERWDDDLIVI